MYWIEAKKTTFALWWTFNFTLMMQIHLWQILTSLGAVWDAWPILTKRWGFLSLANKKSVKLVKSYQENDDRDCILANSLKFWVLNWEDKTFFSFHFSFWTIFNHVNCLKQTKNSNGKSPQVWTWLGKPDDIEPKVVVSNTYLFWVNTTMQKLFKEFIDSLQRY